MAKQTTYNVGIYVRLSQEDERAGESLSIENQKKMLTEYVSKQADAIRQRCATRTCRCTRAVPHG